MTSLITGRRTGVLRESKLHMPPSHRPRRPRHVASQKHARYADLLSNGPASQTYTHGVRRRESNANANALRQPADRTVDVELTDVRRLTRKDAQRVRIGISCTGAAALLLGYGIGFAPAYLVAILLFGLAFAMPEKVFILMYRVCLAAVGRVTGIIDAVAPIGRFVLSACKGGWGFLIVAILAGVTIAVGGFAYNAASKNSA